MESAIFDSQSAKILSSLGICEKQKGCLPPRFSLWRASCTKVTSSRLLGLASFYMKETTRLLSPFTTTPCQDGCHSTSSINFKQSNIADPSAVLFVGASAP